MNKLLKVVAALSEPYRWQGKLPTSWRGKAEVWRYGSRTNS